MLGLPEKKVRKVIQIISHDDVLYRLCDDGTIWYSVSTHWVRCPDVPQGDE
jgi:hypothetical protein